MENNFHLIEQQRNNSASSFMRNTQATIDINQQQIKNKINTTVTFLAKVHNNSTTICVVTPTRFLERNNQPASVSKPNTSKWHLLSLFLLFIIILWFNSIYCVKPLHLSFNSNITFSNLTDVTNLSANQVV